MSSETRAPSNCPTFVNNKGSFLDSFQRNIEPLIRSLSSNNIIDNTSLDYNELNKSKTSLNLNFSNFVDKNFSKRPNSETDLSVNNSRMRGNVSSTNIQSSLAKLKSFHSCLDKIPLEENNFVSNSAIETKSGIHHKSSASSLFDKPKSQNELEKYIFDKSNSTEDKNEVKIENEDYLIGSSESNEAAFKNLMLNFKIEKENLLKNHDSQMPVSQSHLDSTWQRESRSEQKISNSYSNLFKSEISENFKMREPTLKGYGDPAVVSQHERELEIALKLLRVNKIFYLNFLILFNRRKNLN